MSEPTDFTAILARWEAQQPDAIALSFAGSHRTWAQLAERVRRNAAGGLDLFPNQGSGVLTSLAWADGLADIAPGRAVELGDIVCFIPLAELAP